MRRSGIAARAFHALRQLHYSVVLSNTDVAQKLLEIRTLMELAGESFYKYTRLRKGGRFGRKRSAARRSGRRRRASEAARRRKNDRRRHRAARRNRNGDQLEELYRRFPPTLLEVLGVSGIGTKTAGDALRGVRHRVAGRSRSGDRGGNARSASRAWEAKTIENWKRGILAYQRTPAAHAAPQALAIANVSRCLSAAKVRRSNASRLRAACAVQR